MLMGINVRVLLILLLLVFGGVFYIGAKTSPVIVFVFSVCIMSFLLSIYLTKWVLSKDEGPPEMVQVHCFWQLPHLFVFLLISLYFMFFLLVLSLLVTNIGDDFFTSNLLILLHFSQLYPASSAVEHIKLNFIISHRILVECICWRSRIKFIFH